MTTKTIELDKQHEYLLTYEVNRGGFPIAKIYIIDHVNNTISRILGVTKKKLEAQKIAYYYTRDLMNWIDEQGFKVLDIDNAREIITFEQEVKVEGKKLHCTICNNFESTNGNEISRHFAKHFSYGIPDDLGKYMIEVS